MAKTDFKSVGEYISAQPKAVRPVLRRLRSIIRKAVPGAEEVISYQMPAYRFSGAPMLGLAAWKAHYSIYPASDQLMASCNGALDRYRVSTGTLRFPLSEPVPVKLIEHVAKFRAKDARRRAKAKLASRKKGR